MGFSSKGSHRSRVRVQRYRFRSIVGDRDSAQRSALSYLGCARRTYKSQRFIGMVRD